MELDFDTPLGIYLDTGPGKCSALFPNLYGANKDLWGKMFPVTLSMTVKNYIQQ